MAYALGTVPVAPMFGTIPVPQYYTTGSSTPLTYTFDVNSNATQPLISFPITGAVAGPPKDDSPLAWLREQVDEMCELATAA